MPHNIISLLLLLLLHSHQEGLAKVWVSVNITIDIGKFVSRKCIATVVVRSFARFAFLIHSVGRQIGRYVACRCSFRLSSFPLKLSFKRMLCGWVLFLLSFCSCCILTLNEQSRSNEEQGGFDLKALDCKLKDIKIH